MSPILTRPVREQLEHDRVIRLLQARYKRKTDVVINPGNEQNQSITVENLVVFPDLLLFAEGSKRLLATVEVETGESVNPIEARAEWGVYSKLKVPLHLYVPPSCVDAVKRIAAEYQIMVAELWTYMTSFDQVRFTLVHRDDAAPVLKMPPAKPATKPAAAKPKPVAKPAPVVRQAQVRPEPNRAAKAKSKPAGKPKPAAKPKPKPSSKKAAPKPKAKPAKGGKKRR